MSDAAICTWYSRTPYLPRCQGVCALLANVIFVLISYLYSFIITCIAKRKACDVITYLPNVHVIPDEL